MNQQRLFVRKVIYLTIVAVLLVPLSYLSQPSTTDSKGGKLAQLRQAQNLSQANLGKIDPTSSSMKLATFGLHGFAVTMLWNKAIDAKEREDWTGFDAALTQITNLQPHFVQVWKFQAHNVAFNISVEFDDYRDRYRYAIRGTNLLKQGVRYNEKNIRILRDLGFFIGFKIGRSDEKRFFRPLFRSDDEFHSPPPEKDWLLGTRYEGRKDNIRDNWLVSKWWYRQSEILVDSGEAKLEGISPFILHASPARSQIQYALALAEEGEFGDAARDAWSVASDEWKSYSERNIKTTLGYSIRLMDKERMRIRAHKLMNEIFELEPQLVEKTVTRRKEPLSDLEWEAIRTPFDKQTSDQKLIITQVMIKLRIKSRDLFNEMREENRDKGLRLAEQLVAAQKRLISIDKWGDTVNFEVWKERTRIESSSEVLAARKSIFEGKAAYQKSDLPRALEQYKKGIDLWATVLLASPLVLQEESMVYELAEMIEDYREVLQQIKEPFPEDFPLQIVIDRFKFYFGPGTEDGPESSSP